eukprot:1220045-Pyramimonas_sp.AAC.1
MAPGSLGRLHLGQDCPNTCFIQPRAKPRKPQDIPKELPERPKGAQETAHPAPDDPEILHKGPEPSRALRPQMIS